MSKKHKPFATWARGVENKLRAKNMKEVDMEENPHIIITKGDDGIITTPEPHGLLESEILPEDYIFGGTTKMPDVIRKPDGQWDDCLPEKELQAKNGIETNHCTVYGTLNALEAYNILITGVEKNWSERHVGVEAEVSTEYGGYPEKVIEAIRHKGMIPESMLPFDETIKTKSQYNSPKPMIEPYISEANKWLDEYIVMHEWIAPITPASLMASLKRSPVGISVWAWSYDTKTGLYVNPNKERSNHWVICYGYEEGKYWKIYDHYNQDKKKLAWDFPFGHAKKYYLEKKPPMLVTEADGELDNKPVPKGSIISLADAFRFIIKQAGYVGLMFKRLGNKLFGK